MKIDLTREEYKKLLDILSIADWVLNAHKPMKDDRIEPYNELYQKLLALAEQMGCGHLIEYDSFLEGYFPTGEYEDENDYQVLIDEYDDDTFWEELINRLARKDLIKQMGGLEKAASLSLEERYTKMSQLHAYYGEEFSQNGLENLQLRGRVWSSGKSGKAFH